MEDGKVQAKVKHIVRISLLLHSISNGKLSFYNFRIAASILLLRSLDGFQSPSVLSSFSP